MSEIKPIGVPQTVIDSIPSPNINTLPPPVVNNTPPPVVNGIRPPTVDVPDTSIDYPIIDVPTEEDFQGDLSQPQEIPQEEETPDRELPPPNPTIDVGGLEIPLPKPEVAVTSATTAAVTTVAALFSAMLVQQLKRALTPLAKELVRDKKSKKKKKKKGKKPVLHFVENDEGVVEVFEYSEKGVKVTDRVEGNLETYIRDQIEINPYYEQDSKIIVDDVLKERFTKEGAKRFKSLFAPAKVILKKLSARLSF